MRTCIATACLVLVTACTSSTHGGPAYPVSDIAQFNLTQQTCALYVSIRSAALDPVPFGRDVDDEMVRWNKCPGGTMVACAKVPTANGDSVLTGIPWRH